MTTTSETGAVSEEKHVSGAPGPLVPQVEEIVVRMHQPLEGDPCFNGQCRHSWGRHYITFDDKRSGCSAVTSGPRGGNEQSCPCDGFIIMPPQPYRRGGAR